MTPNNFCSQIQIMYDKYLVLFTENVALEAKIKFHDVTRDGVVYHEVKNLIINQNFGDKVTFGLTNLFEGNPQLSKCNTYLSIFLCKIILRW